MINSFLGAEFDTGDDNDTIITRQLDGTAALTYTVTAQVNSLVCHISLSLSLSLSMRYLTTEHLYICLCRDITHCISISVDVRMEMIRT